MESMFLIVIVLAGILIQVNLKKHHLMLDYLVGSLLQFERGHNDEIRTMFDPRLEAITLPKLHRFIDRITNSESVALHVRRGDFTKPNLNYFNVPISYQRKAIRKIVKILESREKSNPVFFVFSDDIWTTSIKFKDFEKKYEMIYVSSVGTTSIEDFYLMTMCKHNIILDSAVNWWTAFLNANPDKIVIASAFSPEF
ncbi:unnamed protein product [Orchesella dallaii]|uniref:L-Fucosyltransferase n=1 Tax=Orchesella dallaii TaxID=48710 RepID=A0ABP1R2P2_9HEXA